MKFFAVVFVLCAALCLTVPAQAQEKPTDASGVWSMTIETPMGGMDSSLTLKIEDGKITGELNSPQGSLALTGTVDAETIKFWGEVNGFVLVFTGKPDPLAMTGTVDFGGNGGGGWSAKRP